MIGIIGYQDVIIGFGLAGVTNKIELTKAATAEEIITAIKTVLQSNVHAILINESLHEKIKGKKNVPDIIYIDIPEAGASSNLEEIEALVKETLGISL